MPEILPVLHFGLFRLGSALSLLTVLRMQRRFNFVLNPGLLRCFLCWNSIFHPMVQPQDYFFTFFFICYHTELFSVHTTA